MIDRNGTDDRPEVLALFAALKARHAELSTLLASVEGHWCVEDYVYRFYHHSAKTSGALASTTLIVAALQGLAPDRPLNADFLAIVDGYQRAEGEHARRRGIIEGLLHATYFLRMAVKYGASLDAPPNLLPSGWAAFLYLYNLR